MIEEQLAYRFRVAVTDEPPLGFNPDDVVERAARTHRRQSAMVAGTAAAAAVAMIGAVVALQVVRGEDGGVGGVATAPTSTPTETKPAPTCPTKPTGTRPTETKPTEPKPTGTRPTETKPTEPKPTEPKPTETKPTRTKPTEPKPTETKPPDPCGTEPLPGAEHPFTGWEDAVKKLQDVMPQVLADHAPGRQFEDVGWKAVEERRCVAGPYQVDGDGYKVVSFVVCHDQKAGLDLTPLGGDYGQLASDTTNPDGSHLRVYRFGDGDEARALSVAHHRPDGVIVHVSTAYKTVRQSGPVVSQEVLTALATDGRVSF